MRALLVFVFVLLVTASPVLAQSPIQGDSVVAVNEVTQASPIVTEAPASATATSAVATAETQRTIDSPIQDPAPKAQISFSTITGAKSINPYSNADLGGWTVSGRVKAKGLLFGQVLMNPGEFNGRGAHLSYRGNGAGIGPARIFGIGAELRHRSDNTNLAYIQGVPGKAEVTYSSLQITGEFGAFDLGSTNFRAFALAGAAQSKDSFRTNGSGVLRRNIRTGALDPNGTILSNGDNISGQTFLYGFGFAATVAPHRAFNASIDVRQVRPYNSDRIGNDLNPWVFPTTTVVSWTSEVYPFRRVPIGVQVAGSAGNKYFGPSISGDRFTIGVSIRR